jgi:hypothetical protein
MRLRRLEKAIHPKVLDLFVIPLINSLVQAGLNMSHKRIIASRAGQIAQHLEVCPVTTRMDIC